MTVLNNPFDKPRSPAVFMNTRTVQNPKHILIVKKMITILHSCIYENATKYQQSYFLLHNVQLRRITRFKL